MKYGKPIVGKDSYLWKEQNYRGEITVDLRHFQKTINTGTSEIENTEYREIQNPYAINKYEGKYIPFGAYDYKVYIVEEEKKYGLIDTNSNIILPFEYDGIYTIDRHKCYPCVNVKKGDVYFIYDFLLMRQVSQEYDKICFCSINAEKYLKVYKNEKCGLIDRSGKELITPQYEDCFGFVWTSGYARDKTKHYGIVKQNGKEGLINECGDFLSDIKYDKITLHYPEFEEHFKNYVIKGTIGKSECFLVDPEKEENSKQIIRLKNYESPTFEHYAGSYAQDEMGYSDDEIDTIFDGDPDAYWNID